MVFIEESESMSDVIDTFSNMIITKKIFRDQIFREIVIHALGRSEIFIKLRKFLDIFW